jgi:hypothetical protein
MAIADDISGALGDLEGLVGETVTIGTWTGTAIVTGGLQAFEMVMGGLYEGVAFTISVRKSSLPSGFTPAPPMTAVVRGYELRIAPNGVTNNRAHWRIAVVDRDTPQLR